MRPPGGILAPGESIVATGNSVFLIFSSLAAHSPPPFSSFTPSTLFLSQHLVLSHHISDEQYAVII